MNGRYTANVVGRFTGIQSPVPSPEVFNCQIPRAAHIENFNSVVSNKFYAVLEPRDNWTRFALQNAAYIHVLCLVLYFTYRWLQYLGWIWNERKSRESL